LRTTTWQRWSWSGGGSLAHHVSLVSWSILSYFRRFYQLFYWFSDMFLKVNSSQDTVPTLNF
jgi:hypothetical protein